MAKCQGKCVKHRGPVMRCEVRDIPNGKDWGFFDYCDEAIEIDRRKGLTVSILDYLGSRSLNEEQNYEDDRTNV